MTDTFRGWEERVIEGKVPPEDVVVLVPFPRELAWLDEMKAGEVLIATHDWNFVGMQPDVIAKLDAAPLAHLRRALSRVEDRGYVAEMKVNDCVMFLSYEYNNVEPSVTIKVFQSGVTRELVMHTTWFMSVFRKFESFS